MKTRILDIIHRRNESLPSDVVWLSCSVTFLIAAESVNWSSKTRNLCAPTIQHNKEKQQSRNSPRAMALSFSVQSELIFDK